MRPRFFYVLDVASETLRRCVVSTSTFLVAIFDDLSSRFDTAQIEAWDALPTALIPKLVRLDDDVLVYKHAGETTSQYDSANAGDDGVRPAKNCLAIVAVRR